MTESTTTAPPLSFHLWHQPWIRATDPDGRVATYSIGACLTAAHTLHALHDPSPLVVGGIHRLLTAILQAIYAPESLEDIAAVLETGQFDPARLDAFAAQHADRFDLFHPTTPFLQTGDVSLAAQTDALKPKSVASLFSEVPGATYRTHFHHVTDDSHQICPACCIRGILTIPAFASSGGAGIYPSINGVPPVYVVPAGDTLFHSLALSLTAPDYQPDSAEPERSEVAAWNGPTTIAKNHEVSTVGYLESLTFPARRMRLFPIDERASCTQCGVLSDITVRAMLFDMGHRRRKEAAIWDDPFVAFQQPGGKRSMDAPRPVRPQEGKALWREYTALLLTTQDQQELRPKIVRQLGYLISDNVLSERHLVRFRCIGVRTDGKAKVFEWLDEALDAPPRLLVDPDGALLVADALERADATGQMMNQVFNLHFRPERERGRKVKPDLVRFKTLRNRMQTLFWERLEPEFRQLVFAASDPDQRLTLERTWADTLVRIGERTFIETSDQAGDRADALRARVEAQAECHRRLYTKRKEWIGER